MNDLGSTFQMSKFKSFAPTNSSRKFRKFVMKPHERGKASKGTASRDTLAIIQLIHKTKQWQLFRFPVFIARTCLGVWHTTPVDYTQVHTCWTYAEVNARYRTIADENYLIANRQCTSWNIAGGRQILAVSPEFCSIVTRAFDDRPHLLFPPGIHDAFTAFKKGKV